MLEEAAEVGAHGVVGVVDTSATLWPTWASSSSRSRARRCGSTTGRRPPAAGPWTTYLAGQRLAKLIEAGYAPVSIAAAVASVRVWANCITEYLTEGSNSMYCATPSPGAEIDQTVKAHMVVRRLARRAGPRPAGHDSLHGAAMATTERELGQGDAELQCILRGNRVRRFKEFDPVPAPPPTVRLL